MTVPATARPPALTRLCILSFFNQGVMFPLYLLGIVAASLMRDADPALIHDTARTLYGGMFGPEEMDRVYDFLDVLQEHGVALMSVFALRTLARFIGVLRMWRLQGIGFHIYTTAQLLGILLPMLIAGTKTFSLPGLLAAVLWCLMYFTRMRMIGALGSGLGKG